MEYSCLYRVTILITIETKNNVNKIARRHSKDSTLAKNERQEQKIQPKHNNTIVGCISTEPRKMDTIKIHYSVKVKNILRLHQGRPPEITQGFWRGLYSSVFGIPLSVLQTTCLLSIVPWLSVVFYKRTIVCVL